MKRRGIMLCMPFEESRLAKWTPPFIIQPKLDGERCRALVDDSGVCRLLSSEENVIISVPHINAAIESLHLRSIELDGELYVHGASFSDIHSIVSRRENIHPDSQYMELHLFDIVGDGRQLGRTLQLLELLPERKTGIPTGGVLHVVPTRAVHDLESIMKGLEDYISRGYEGIIVRDAFAPYVRKRSTQMMKFKPRKEDLYEITGTAEEVSIEGVPKNSLGALICNGSGATFNVGSGSLLTREAREQLWQVREGLIGKYARVKYQHLTTAQGVPRFPVVVEIVDSIGGEQYDVSSPPNRPL